jgi:long-subunit acyl-CoA synthetase (AMP-forming)
LRPEHPATKLLQQIKGGTHVQIETSPQPTTIEQTLTEPTLCRAFVRTADANADRVALMEFGSDRSLTYAQWFEQASRIAGGLSELGVGYQDRVGLLLGPGLEFHVVDMGALLLGAVPYSMYSTSPASQLAPSAANAEPRVVFTQVALAETARELQQAVPVIERIVVVDGEAGPGELDLPGLMDLCPTDFEVRAHAERVQPDDLCSLVYTSGTTGQPKGVPYQHRCVMQTMDSLHRHVPYGPAGRVISYLPMAHIAERMFGHYAGFVFGCRITALPNAKRLSEALVAVRPTRFFGVPRIWEKLLAGLHRAISEMPPDESAEVRAAWDRSIARVQAEQGRGAAPQTDASPEDPRILAPLAAMVGLDAAEWLGVAGAPAGADTLIALHAIGLPVNELYGMSETIICSTSPPDRVKIGSCGVPLPGVKIRIADDGEILVGGVTVMPGYFRDPERTAEVLIDGWMHSGDIGKIDEAGYLWITDRKKALIINSAGKNMSPAMIEHAIQGGLPLISHVVAIGDRRAYNVALIVLDRDGLAAFCRTRALPEAEFTTLTKHPEVVAEVERAVQDGNAKLARVEQIKRFAILDHEWLPASETLTPTAKLRRGAITERYADVIEGLYG